MLVMKEVKCTTNEKLESLLLGLWEGWTNFGFCSKK